jgi:Cft2 family RNA processing exonuclease
MHVFRNALRKRHDTPTILQRARTVTGSQHLIEVNRQRILLECGMYQGKRAAAYERNRNFPFDPKSINAMVLSHAHIDHSGKAANSAFCPNLHLREQGG